MDVAETNRLPLLLLVESGGADLPRQADVFVPGGEQFRRLTQLSAQGIPTICVVFGSSTAGGAYLPGMSDYTVMVDGRARVFLGGPPAGQDGHRRGRRRGGARRGAHARPHVGAVRLPGPGRGRRPSHRPRHRGPPALVPPRSRPSGPGVEPPLYPAEELLGIAPVDVRVPFDVREILARVVDGSRFEEFKTSYGAQLVCGWASLGGYPVGVRGQQRHPLLRGGPEGGPVHRAVQPQRHPDPLRAEHHRVHGGHPLRAGRDHQGRGQADQRRVQLDRAPPHPHGRRQLRRRQLRHGRAGLRPPLRLHLAQPPHRRHGAQAAGRRPLHRAPQRGGSGRAALRRAGGRGAARRHRGPDRRGVDGAVRHRPAVGRRHHRSRATRARCWPSR